MTLPGMLDLTQSIQDGGPSWQQEVRKPRRSKRSKRITKMFTVGIVAAMLGGGAAIVQNAPQADAITQAQINRYIKSEGGIPPCTHEDGAGQGICYWNARTQGNGDGDSYISLPDGKDRDDDKDLVYLTGPLAVRY